VQFADVKEGKTYLVVTQTGWYVFRCSKKSKNKIVGVDTYGSPKYTKKWIMYLSNDKDIKQLYTIEEVVPETFENKYPEYCL